MKPKALLDEEKLQRLLNANNPEERNKWALEWKKQGKKVIGMIDYYVPVGGNKKDTRISSGGSLAESVK